MEVKKLVGFAIPVMMLLSSCGIENKTSKETKTVPQSISKVMVSEDDYPQYVLDLGNELNKAFETCIKTINNNQSRKKVLANVEGANKTLTKFESIEYPNRYVNTQKNLEKSISSYKKALSIIRDSYSKDKIYDKGVSTEVLENIKPYLQDGDNYWTTVYKELINDVTRSKGGSLDSEDLKETDNGVDYEKVKNSVVDGKELTGNWGMVRSGKFITTFILKDGNPKTFEIYTKDDYPSKKNVIEGTWEYDRDNMLMKLHITKQVSSGIVVRVKQKNIDYKVQNYDTNYLQVYNWNAQTINRNVKQK
ncbi:TPA: DUF3994 domain-containing protein [Bacillus pseudomycoides]|nr:DUF3994 domain-containing protein [Bacillus pseudomycoides]